jgi:hypothetical protein
MGTAWLFDGLDPVSTEMSAENSNAPIEQYALHFLNEGVAEEAAMKGSGIQSH